MPLETIFLTVAIVIQSLALSYAVNGPFLLPYLEIVETLLCRYRT